MCMCAGEECRDDPLPVSPKVWAALNRRVFYVLVINGFFGRSMEWFWLKRLGLGALGMCPHIARFETVTTT